MYVLITIPMILRIVHRASHGPCSMHYLLTNTSPAGTKQACLFRDNFDHLSSTGLTIYGLSGDSPKANTTFKTKQNLPYALLCNPSYGLIGAIGLKKSPKGTIRGVFAVDKKGKVLLREQGGPDATVDAVQKIVADGPAKEESKEDEKDESKEKNGDGAK